MNEVDRYVRDVLRNIQAPPHERARIEADLRAHLQEVLDNLAAGESIGYKEAFLRRLSYYFEFVIPDALFIPFTAKRQRAFDIIARTVVIREIQT